MNIKRILIITLILIAIFSSISVASANLFDVLNAKEPAAFDEFYVTSPESNTERMDLHWSITSDQNISMENKTVHVNVTNESGKTQTFDINLTDGNEDYDNATKLYTRSYSQVIDEFEPGDYKVFAYFPGDKDVNETNFTAAKITIKKYEEPQEETTDDIKDNSTEYTTSEDNSTEYTTSEDNYTEEYEDSYSTGYNESYYEDSDYDYDYNYDYDYDYDYDSGYNTYYVVRYYYV